MEINKYYHKEQMEAELYEHLRKFEEGDPVRIGNEYAFLSGRDGRSYEGPFTALAYDNGLLMLGKADKRVFAFINEDVVANGSELYMEHLPNLVKFKSDLSTIIGQLNREECCKALRSACSVKWMCPLSMEGARLLLQWYMQW